MSKNKVLVAYFSASGTTEKVARKNAQISDGDLYEIKPKVPYTMADLDWMNPKSRSSVEMKDPQSRPELAEKNANIASYDTILLGFPIWWYVAPRIINTFLESYDFSGKRIILFATSGGSGFGGTVSGLKTSVANNTLLIEGKILNGHLSDSDLKDWLDGVLTWNTQS